MVECSEQCKKVMPQPWCSKCGNPGRTRHTATTRPRCRRSNKSDTTATKSSKPYRSMTRVGRRLPDKVEYHDLSGRHEFLMPKIMTNHFHYRLFPCYALVELVQIEGQLRGGHGGSDGRPPRQQFLGRCLLVAVAVVIGGMPVARQRCQVQVVAMEKGKHFRTGA